MRIAIYARIPADAQCLERLLRRKFSELCADVSVLSFSQAHEFLAALSGCAFAFLDADLEEPPSLEFARMLRLDGFDDPIAFFSESTAHALDCYGVHPSGYLVKPFDYNALCKILDWHRNAFIPALRYINVIIARVSVKVYLIDIEYIEVHGHKCILHLMNGVITTNCSLASLAAQLNDAPFLHCQRYYLANMNHILDVTPDTIHMDNGRILPIGAEGAAQIKNAYQMYQRELFE